MASHYIYGIICRTEEDKSKALEAIIESGKDPELFDIQVNPKLYEAVSKLNEPITAPLFPPDISELLPQKEQTQRVHQKRVELQRLKEQQKWRKRFYRGKCK